MSVKITLRITDKVTGKLERLSAKLTSKGIQERATRVVGNTLKARLLLINHQRPNALGGKRTNFFAKASRSVMIAFNDFGGTVTVVIRGFRYQVKGGTIKPSGRMSAITGKPITHLAIPIAAEAHGKVPSDFGNLFLLRGKNRNQALLARKKGRGKNAEIVLLYVLKTSVTKKPDPTLLPTEADVQAAVFNTFKPYFRG